MNLSTFTFTDNPPTGKGRAFAVAQLLLGFALRMPTVLTTFEAGEPSSVARMAVVDFVAALAEANTVGAGRLLSPDLRAELETLARRCAPVAKELGIEE